MRHRRLTVALAAAAVLLLAACGGDETAFTTTEPTTPADAEPAPTAATPDADAADATVDEPTGAATAPSTTAPTGTGATPSGAATDAAAGGVSQFCDDLQAWDREFAEANVTDPAVASDVVAGIDPLIEDAPAELADPMRTIREGLQLIIDTGGDPSQLDPTEREVFEELYDDAADRIEDYAEDVCGFELS